MKKKTTEELVLELKQIYGDKYDYSLVEYINFKTKVNIICKKHNSLFSQRVDHLLKHEALGCKECAKEARIKKFSKTTKQFIEEAKLIHGDKYDYSLVEYINSKIKVKIICKRCGSIFEQTPNKHTVRKHGCDYCGGTATKTTKQFIEEAKLIHGNKYDYSLTDYNNNSTNIKIICKKCGSIFEQLPANHLKGCGCGDCNISNKSKYEEQIKNWLIKNYIDFEQQKKFEDLKDVKLLSYDFYIPSKKLLIECNGKQHYKFISYFYKTNHEFHKQLHHDWLKRKYAKDNKFNLLVIPYWEFNNIEEQLQDL